MVLGSQSRCRSLLKHYQCGYRTTWTVAALVTALRFMFLPGCAAAGVRRAVRRGPRRWRWRRVRGRRGGRGWGRGPPGEERAAREGRWEGRAPTGVHHGLWHAPRVPWVISNASTSATGKLLAMSAGCPQLVLWSARPPGACTPARRSMPSLPPACISPPHPERGFAGMLRELALCQRSATPSTPPIPPSTPRVVPNGLPTPPFPLAVLSRRVRGRRPRGGHRRARVRRRRGRGRYGPEAL